RTAVRPDRLQLRRRAGELRICGESRDRPRRPRAANLTDLLPGAEHEHPTPELLEAQLGHVGVRVRGRDLREGRTAAGVNADGARGEDEEVRLALRDVQRKQLHVRAGGTGRDVPEPRPKSRRTVRSYKEVVTPAKPVLVVGEVG